MFSRRCGQLPPKRAPPDSPSFLSLRNDTTAIAKWIIACRKTPWGGLEGFGPPNAIRTRRHARRVREPCAARFSISHFRGDAGRGGKPLPVPSAAAACTPPGAAASRFRYHVPPVRFAHRNMMSPFAARRLPTLQRKTVPNPIEKGDTSCLLIWIPAAT